VVALLGRNGAGKTTTMKSIMGLVPRRVGSVQFRGRELCGASPEAIARAGIALCPEERGIFGSLSVTENLMLPPVVAPGGLSVPEIYVMFPNLKERARTAQGTKLSGGEQQMLAIGRILRTGAKMLLLDEPTEGLAPVIVQQIGRTIQEIKQRGFTVLLVEQNDNDFWDSQSSAVRAIAAWADQWRVLCDVIVGACDYLRHAEHH
jgi:branched-chain amino acid transport system ATP-binding protein